MEKNGHLVFGVKGESVAERFLWASGYEVLERNWRYKRCEIDLIARKDDWLIFIEVKTRRNHLFGYPEEFVGPKKLAKMLEASEAFCEMKKISSPVRFDVIAIIKNREKEEVEHFEDVYFPDWM